jgi:hypothetical protein
MTDQEIRNLIAPAREDESPINFLLRYLGGYLEISRSALAQADRYPKGTMMGWRARWEPAVEGYSVALEAIRKLRQAVDAGKSVVQSTNKKDV